MSDSGSVFLLPHSSGSYPGLQLSPLSVVVTGGSGLATVSLANGNSRGSLAELLLAEQTLPLPLPLSFLGTVVRG